MVWLHRSLLVVHLLALVGWLGLATGAWLLLRRIESEVKPEVLWRAFGKVVQAKHHFLGLLVASGLGLLGVVGFPFAKVLWFSLKMGILLCVIVPIECADVVQVARLIHDPSAERIARFRRFVAWAGAALIVAGVAIISLGKFRPGS
ncbi:MAG: hypothetical protein HYY16_11505 [Planctomycetes bacterium]|nr:hypothetical protein [Planctomycetota bacterium]